jgi:plasmid stability protein
MPEKTKRSTIYLEEQLHRALRLKAAELDLSMSDIVNDALRLSLTEDAEDLDDVNKRTVEKTVSFEKFVTGLKASGQL